MREGNNILGVYACNPDRPPVAIRYLVDLAVPGAEITVGVNGKKYTVCSSLCKLILLVSLSLTIITHKGLNRNNYDFVFKRPKSRFWTMKVIEQKQGMGLISSVVVFLLSSLSIMPKSVTASHTVCVHLSPKQFWGRWVPAPCDCGHGWPTGKRLSPQVLH